MSLVTIVEMVPVIFSLKNVRCAPGDAGKLQQITTIKNETPTHQYVQPNGDKVFRRRSGVLHLLCTQGPTLWCLNVVLASSTSLACNSEPEVDIYGHSRALHLRCMQQQAGGGSLWCFDAIPASSTSLAISELKF